MATADWSLKTSDVREGQRRQWRADRALRPAMRSPGRPDPSRVVQRRFWRLIATGVTTVEASLADAGRGLRRTATLAATARCCNDWLNSPKFRSRTFVSTLTRHCLADSMGRVGAAGDNAAMESFFELLQKNVPHRQVWATRPELRTAIV